ncbi:hypothetical protein [Streptosporangium saharense]|uniref:Uncharacterized protein n=1 Tax=Streptosporangium saharense TaxID=1706840 RepID=A0A7W7QJL6_9ACTN|nr:hypothetical protein [Streptosporangium saharense]MBB4914781.1 hypothetical protein [Streptosporangium saharense]
MLTVRVRADGAVEQADRAMNTPLDVAGVRLALVGGQPYVDSGFPTMWRVIPAGQCAWGVGEGTLAFRHWRYPAHPHTTALVDQLTAGAKTVIEDLFDWVDELQRVGGFTYGYRQVACAVSIVR